LRGKKISPNTTEAIEGDATAGRVFEGENCIAKK